MGLFDFIKNVGANILGKGNDAEDTKNLLQKDIGDKITNLNVEFDGGA